MQKVLRSLIQETFDEDTRNEIELISLRRDLFPEEKPEAIINLLREKGIPDIGELGVGTNRFALKIKGYAVKIATDNDGKIDNKKEFRMAPELFPYVANTYEVSDNGTILVAEYIQPFKSLAHMAQYKDEILEILERLSERYLIGDVGLTGKNFANWGLRLGTSDPVCLDFAYVYEVSSKLFLCSYCDQKSMLIPTDDYSSLVCPSCGRPYTFQYIREKIGNDISNHHIGDLEEVGYKLCKSNTLTTLDKDRSPYIKVRKNNTNEKVVKESKGDTKEMAGKVVVKLTGRVIGKDEQYTPSLKQAVVAGKCISANKNDSSEATLDIDTTHSHKDKVTSEDKVAMVIDMKNNNHKPSVTKSETVCRVIKDDDVEDTEFSNEFLENNNIYKTVSKVSNEITSFLNHQNIWEDINGYIINANYTKEEFSADISSAIFRSLTKFLNFNEEKKEVNGTMRTVFNQPSNICGEHVETFKFLYNYWKDGFTRIPNMGEFDVIEDEWLDVLRERILEKIPITKTGASVITTTVGIEWCDIDRVEENTSELFEDSISVEVCTSNDKPFDIIKIFNGYILEPGIYIPLFNKWNEVDSTVADGSINGYWDWLKHMTPSNISLVDDPHKYMKINNIENFPFAEHTIKVAYLGKINNKHAMGIYIIGNMIRYEDKDNTDEITTADIEILKGEELAKVNNLVNSNFGSTDLSFYKYSLQEASEMTEDNKSVIDDVLQDAMAVVRRSNGNSHTCECGHEHEAVVTSVNVPEVSTPEPVQKTVEEKINVDVEVPAQHTQPAPNVSENIQNNTVVKNMINQVQPPMQAPQVESMELEIPEEAEEVKINMNNYTSEEMEDFVSSDIVEIDDLDIESFNIEEHDISDVSKVTVTDDSSSEEGFTVTPIIPEKFQNQ